MIDPCRPNSEVNSSFMLMTTDNSCQNITTELPPFHYHIPWVPFLAIGLLILVSVLLVTSCYSYRIRVLKRRENAMDYLELDIDVNRKKLCSIMRVVVRPEMFATPMDQAELRHCPPKVHRTAMVSKKQRSPPGLLNREGYFTPTHEENCTGQHMPHSFIAHALCSNILPQSPTPSLGHSHGQTSCQASTDIDEGSLSDFHSAHDSSCKDSRSDLSLQRSEASFSLHADQVSDDERDSVNKFDPGLAKYQVKQHRSSDTLDTGFSKLDGPTFGIYPAFLGIINSFPPEMSGYQHYIEKQTFHRSRFDSVSPECSLNRENTKSKLKKWHRHADTEQAAMYLSSLHAPQELSLVATESNQSRMISGRIDSKKKFGSYKPSAPSQLDQGKILASVNQRQRVDPCTPKLSAFDPLGIKAASGSTKEQIFGVQRSDRAVQQFTESMSMSKFTPQNPQIFYLRCSTPETTGHSERHV